MRQIYFFFCVMFSLCLQRYFSTCLLTGFDYGIHVYGLCIHVNVGPSQTFPKKYSEINAKNLQYNVHVILAGMYIKKKVYLKNTNRASIKEITDFGMILRPYKLLVIAKVRRRWYTSECRSVWGSGSENLGEARTAHSMGVPIHLHRWRHELWRWCGRDYHVTFQ